MRNSPADPKCMSANQARWTIAQTGHLAGPGLQTNRACQLRLVPTGADTPEGIVFQRLDLPNRPSIRGDLAARDRASLRTTNLRAEGVSVGTVEHLLAALKGLGIDDVLVQVDGPEVPICDGSARAFVQLLKECGRVQSRGIKPVIAPEEPISWTSQKTHMVALPSSCFRISCMIHYPNCPLIKTQYFTSPIDEAIFERELAPARTFCLLEEAEWLQSSGHMLGGSLENALVIDSDRVLSSENLRYFDEMVRHKVLDLIGDLALLDAHLLAHIVAICPSHETNAHLAEALNFPQKA